MSASGKLRFLANDHLAFKCPGCNSFHVINFGGTSHGPRWAWSGSASAPTFRPSVLVTYDGLDAGQPPAPPAVCHSFVTDGWIEFLQDSTHGLAGQRVELPNVEDSQ